MPELPEVETVRRGLEPVLVGQRLVRIEQRRPDLRFAFPEGFAQRLTGRTVEALGRRAKYLLVHLNGGEVLVMHMGMSGRFTISQPVDPVHDASVHDASVHDASVHGASVHGGGTDCKHDHVVFTTAAGASVTYNDARRFGYMTLIGCGELEAHKFFRDLGPEPLGNGLDEIYLAAAARRRKCDLKTFLMDQRVIAGLGNIYVCEALHRAALNPGRAAASLASKKTGKPLRRATVLVDAVRRVLREAIAAGGSTLRDYAQADGSMGYFQHAFKVYGREGQPCRTSGCSGAILRSTHAGRSTFHCAKCQR